MVTSGLDKFILAKDRKLIVSFHSHFSLDICSRKGLCKQALSRAPCPLSAIAMLEVPLAQCATSSCTPRQ